MRELNEALRISRHYGPVFSREFCAAVSITGAMILGSLMLVGFTDGAKNSAPVSAPRMVSVEAGR